jgi:hypothetical protein
MKRKQSIQRNNDIVDGLEIPCPAFLDDLTTRDQVQAWKFTLLEVFFHFIISKVVVWSCACHYLI